MIYGEFTFSFNNESFSHLYKLKKAGEVVFVGFSSLNSLSKEVSMKSVSIGYVTNSSSVITVLIFEVNDNTLKKIKELNLDDLISKAYKAFIKDDMHTDHEVFENFNEEVKSSIKDAYQKLLKFIESHKGEEICLKTDCDIDGNSYDYYRPEVYATWFLIKQLARIVEPIAYKEEY